MTWPPEAGAAGAVVVVVAGVAAAVAGSAAGMPMSSSTTGALANGSFGVVDCFADGATCECVSLTTGTVRVVVT